MEVMVWNWKTQKYEKATKEEGDAVIGLIVSNITSNADYISEDCPACGGYGVIGNHLKKYTRKCPTCKGTGKKRA